MEGFVSAGKRYALLSLLLLFATITRALAAPSTQPDAQPTYYVIPIAGGVVEGMSDAFAKALEAARAAKATHVLLVLDTPGGLVDEMNAMLELMAASKEFQFVALVDNAGSAGAVLAMACPDIVITPSGAMGAAAMVGLPKDATLRMKIESYNAAKVRAAVEAAGHDVLIARGMMEPGLELRRIVRDGKSRIVDPEELRRTGEARGRKFKLPDGAKMSTLKDRGKLISLTPAEAVELGVARGIVQTSQRPGANDVRYPLDDIPPLIGLAAWKQVGSAEPMMRKLRAAVEREAHLTEHKQELDDIDAKAKSLQQTANSLQDQINQQQAAIEDLPNNARGAARGRITTLQNQLNATLDEIRQLNNRKKEILRGPKAK